ncbi:FGGY-family carbohydrate kinase [Geminicoccus roseus]|uniref:FGGY-family carbohydrate kinase n=1 Tax=Geminicoccus roseus TaxID=404900 RepID=UPI00041F76D4|nr:FGGY family carbohydrate kinase [Geminicoccus roseus]
MSEGQRDAVLVLDVGKTNMKLLAIDTEGTILGQSRAPNRPLPGPPWQHPDVEATEAWLMEALRDLARQVNVVAIVPTAYGSTCAMLDAQGELAFPIMDYEDEHSADVIESYAREAPPFNETFCSVAPNGMLLARQLWRARREHPEQFAKVATVVPLGQYWGFRLTGELAWEQCALGAQTQLIATSTGEWSSVARKFGFDRLFPKRLRAGDVLGRIRPEIAEATGVPTGTPVRVGIHDSNADYGRYRMAGLEHFTLLSSGTWLITFDTDLPLGELDPARDMVSNTDFTGKPVATARFMAGREFDLVSQLMGPGGAEPDEATVARLIARGTMALPTFNMNGDTFPGTGGKGRVVGPPLADANEARALASLYVALGTDVVLDLLKSKSQLILAGGLAKDRQYAPILAALRAPQPLSCSSEPDSTALGAAELHWRLVRPTPTIALTPVAPARIPGLEDYQAQWKQAVQTG